MKNSAFTALLFAIACFACIAQTPSRDQSVQTQKTTASASHKKAPDYSREPFIYEFIHARMRYENNGDGIREVTARARVNSAVGLNLLGQLIFDYNAANEQLEIRRVRVLKQDGSAVSVGADSVQDLTAPIAREAPMYTDARQKHVTVPALAVGDAIEYEVVTTAKSLLPGQFWQTWNFNDNTICLDEQVDLDVPAGRVLKIKSPAGVDPVIREEGSRRIYHWATSTTHYPDRGEMLRNFKFDAASLLQGNQPPTPRQIIFSTLQSWADVGRWYAELEHDRRVITPEIRVQADEIVKGHASDREKAQALYQWVARNIRYVSLSFGVGRYQPHAAAEVLSHRYGDCKDKTTLLEAFLEAEGVRSNAALINSRVNIDPDVPSPLQFDHAITYVDLDGQPAWLDSTLGVGPFMYLLPQLRGKQSLVVFTDAASAPALKKTPESLPMPALYRIAVNGEVDKEGKMSALLSFDTRGDAEVLLRLTLMQLPPGQLAAIMEKAAAAQKEKQGDFSFRDLKTDDAMDTSKPFHAELRMTTDIGTQGLDKPASSEINDFMRGFLGSKRLDSLLPELASKAKDKSLWLGGPTEYSLEVTITMPSASAAGKPESVQITREFVDYQAASEWNDRTFRGRWSLKIRIPEISGDQLKEYASFRKELLNSVMLNDVGTIKSGKVGLPSTRPSPSAHIRPPDAETLYQQGIAEVKLKNWGNAEQKFEAVIKLDPNDKMSLNELGRARMYLRKYDAAEATFRKLMEIAPDDHLSNAQMAWVLTTEKKYQEAAQVLEKRVAAVPEDGDAHHRLGLAYMLMKDYDKAVPELEKTTTLLPNNASAHFLLGRAYLKTHDHDKGAKEFEKGLGIQTDDVNLNEAAYELAVEKARLDLAESWAARAVRDMEVELNQAAITNLDPRTMTFALRAGMYWDTLGWIKFQQKDYATAEKYVNAAWQLTDSTTEGYHLGRVYEALQKKDEAIEAYAEMLALASTLRTVQAQPSDDEKDGRVRLAALLGNDSAVDQRITRARAALKERRSVIIENKAGTEGMAEYVAVAGADGKIIDLRPVNPQNQLQDLTAAIRSAVVPLSFPDPDISRLPFSGVVTCPRADGPCKLSIMAAGLAGNTLISGAAQNVD